MTVDFNNLRKQACYAYDRLCTKLNEAIDEDGNIEISAEEIQDDMDELRQNVMIIACVFEEGNEEFREVSEEVRPIAWFNEDIEENDEPEDLE